MEIKRKKLTNEEIFSFEQKFAKEVSDVCENRNPDFRAIGYELDLEFGQKENEAQSRFSILSKEETKKYESGYVSRALITVKRQKTEAEKEEDLRLQQENLALIESSESDQEAEQLENDETLRRGEDENKRSVAFTRVMLVRAYKSFWTEWISIGDNLEQLEADLQEFLEVLTQKKEENM